MGFVVAVDGPAGSGKGTITKKIAKEMNLTSIDTGAMYRSVTLAMLNENIALDDLEKISKLLDEIKIELKKIDGVQKVYLNGKDVSLEIRTKPVNENVSPVSTIKIVRERLAKLQREMAETIDVIMEGRDIGTNVFPNADVKIYVTLDDPVGNGDRVTGLERRNVGIRLLPHLLVDELDDCVFVHCCNNINSFVLNIPAAP